MHLPNITSGVPFVMVNGKVVTERERQVKLENGDRIWLGSGDIFVFGDGRGLPSFVEGCQKVSGKVDPSKIRLIKSRF